MSTDRTGGLTDMLALAIGIPLAMAGVFLVGVYVVGVVDIIINQPPDRSWLFWGLALAFIGVFCLTTGVVLLVVWWRARSQPDR